MFSFSMNGYFWKVRFVDEQDSSLVDRTGHRTIATTDPVTHTINLAQGLDGDFLVRVLIHELGHCAMISYDLLDDIHRMTYPEHWIEAEEWVCNFIADYGFQIFSVAYDMMGDKAWLYVPYRIDRALAS